MKLTQAALSALLLVVSACATQRSQTREPATTAQKEGAKANPPAQAKKVAGNDDKLICEWLAPDTGSHIPQKVCHLANEVQPEPDEPDGPAGGFTPAPSIQTKTGIHGGG